MKNELTNNEILNKIDELNSSVFDRIDEVKSMVKSDDTFDGPEIIKKCQQIDTLLNQIEVLQGFIKSEGLVLDPLKSNPFLN
ncbi:MAG: hypothetical protein WCJ95_18725 [Mariniphaga sp.]